MCRNATPVDSMESRSESEPEPEPELVVHNPTPITLTSMECDSDSDSDTDDSVIVLDQLERGMSQRERVHTPVPWTMATSLFERALQDIRNDPNHVVIQIPEPPSPCPCTSPKQEPSIYDWDYLQRTNWNSPVEKSKRD